jgi:hypothetical protein
MTASERTSAVFSVEVQSVMSMMVLEFSSAERRDILDE